MTVDEVLAILQGAGHRITRQRRVLIEAALSRRRHFTASDIAAEVRDELPSLGRATVFRTLDALASLGLLSRIHLSDNCHGYIACQSGDHHHHLICSQCGLVVKVPGCALSPQAERSVAAMGFRIDGHHLEYYGLCANCQHPAQDGAEGWRRSGTILAK